MMGWNACRLVDRNEMRVAIDDLQRIFVAARRCRCNLLSASRERDRYAASEHSFEERLRLLALQHTERASDRFKRGQAAFHRLPADAPGARPSRRQADVLGAF